MLALESLRAGHAPHRWTTVRVAAAAALLGLAATAHAADSTLTVVRNGTGSGTVAASSGAIDCGSTCVGAYADGTMLTLTATPSGTSRFTGWLGPCTGTGACPLTIAGATTVRATFAPLAIGPPRLDADGTGDSKPITDGLLIVRHLFGLGGPLLVKDALGQDGARRTSAAVASYLGDILPALDIDGDGRADALTDGVLIVRYLFGTRGAPLIAGAVGGGAARADVASIEAKLLTFFEPVVVEPPLFSGSYPPPDRGALTALPLPPVPGQPGFMLLQLPEAIYYFDPAQRTPVSAAAECAAVVLTCYQAGAGNVAGCFANVPQCATNTPWLGNDPMCCAAACGARYQELLTAGETKPAALTKAIFRAPSCMPGLAGYPPMTQ